MGHEAVDAEVPPADEHEDQPQGGDASQANDREEAGGEASPTSEPENQEREEVGRTEEGRQPAGERDRRPGTPGSLGTGAAGAAARESRQPHVAQRHHRGSARGAEEQRDPRGQSP